MEEIKTTEQKFDEYFLESTRKRFGRMRFEVDVYLLRDDLKLFIQSEIDLAVSKERERVTSKTDEVWSLLCQMDTNIKSEKEYAKDIINLINTK